MQPNSSIFVDTEVASFSGLLEKLSGCGIVAAPLKPDSRQTRPAVSRESAEIAELSYEPWPATTGPWRAAKARPAKGGCAPGHGGRSRTRTLPSQQRNGGPAWAGLETEQPDEENAVASAPPGVEDRGLAAPSRRAVVSIRMTEEEMAQLRQRASESGISISEYVRSCVVEADQLRVQVKRVVADMRSVPAVDRHDAAGVQFISAQQDTAGTRNWTSWLRHLVGMLLGGRGSLIESST